MKKLSIKSITILVLSFFLALSLFGFGATMLNTKAEITVGQNGVASSGFEMTNGALIMEKTTDAGNEIGIRWETNVSQAFQDYASGLGTNVEYKTLVVGINQLDADGVLDMDTPNKAVLSGTIEDGKYTGSIIYAEGDVNEGQWETIKEAAYKAELVARACVIIDDTTVIYAKADDTQRSMRGVAAYAKVNGETGVDEFVGTSTVKDLTEAPWYDDDVKQLAVANDIANGTYTAYANAKLVGSVQVENGVATFSEAFGDTIAEGRERNLCLFGAEGKDFISMQFINPYRIYQATDFDKFAVFNEAYYYQPSGDVDNVKPVDKGYYMLMNNIDASSYTAKVKHFDSSELKAASSNEHHAVGFRGVFDGRGYTIDGLTVGEGGLFGVIGGKTGKTSENNVEPGGTVKNVAFTNAKINVAEGGKKAGVLAGAIYHYATIENVYIEVADFGTKGMRGALAYAVNENTYLKKVLIVDKDSANNGRSYTTTDGTANGTTATDGATIFVYRTAAQSSSNLTDGGKINTNDWKNVFTVSDMYDLGGKFSGNRSILKTLNSSTKNFNDGDLCNRLLPNLYSFASFADIEAKYTANQTESNGTVTWNIFESIKTFSADYWTYDTTTGTLSWKNIPV